MATSTTKTQAKKTTSAAQRTSTQAAKTTEHAQRTAQAVVADGVYAAVGVGDSAVAALRWLPKRVDALRTDGLRTGAVEEFDQLARRGRGVVTSVTRGQATQRALAQTKAARSQLKAAATSVRKTFGASAEAVDTAADKVGQERSDSAKAKSGS